MDGAEALSVKRTTHCQLRGQACGQGFVRRLWWLTGEKVWGKIAKGKEVIGTSVFAGRGLGSAQGVWGMYAWLWLVDKKEHWQLLDPQCVYQLV